jgi:transketolase C-terminal domain/subunit
VWAARGLLESDLLGITAGLEAAGIRFFTDPEELRSAFTAFASRRGGPG